MTWLTALTAWPAPIGPDVGDRPAHRRQDRPGALDVGLVAADEDREGRVPSALAAARDGGVDHPQLALGETRGEIPAARRSDRRAVDDERPGPCAGDQPVGGEQDRFDVRRVGHADDRDARLGDGLGRRVSHRDAQVEQLGRAAGRPVPARHREAGPGQVGGHRRAHRAEAEERDATALRGRRLPSSSAGPARAGARPPGVGCRPGRLRRQVRRRFGCGCGGCAGRGAARVTRQSIPACGVGFAPGRVRRGRRRSRR